MKLVDILTRELPAWPEGVKFITQQGGGYLFDEANYPLDILASTADDNLTGVVERAQWQAAVDALKAAESVVPVWDGDGLPPVGTVCEHSEDDNKSDSPDGAWKRVKIVGHHQFNDDEYLCVVWVSGLEVSYSSEGSHFRPIRMPEQIAADERHKALIEMLRSAPAMTTCVAGALYDAGYRKTSTTDN